MRKDKNDIDSGSSFHPVDSFQEIRAPFPLPHKWHPFHPNVISHCFQAPMPLNVQEIRVPFPLPHKLPQFHPSGISHVFQAPIPLNVQTGPLLGLPQFHPSGNFLGIHAPVHPINRTVAFQRTFPESTSLRESMLEKEIREIVFSLQPPRLPIESLANMYIERYGKPLRIEGFRTEGQHHGKAGCNLIDLLMKLNTTRVVKSQGQHYIVLVEDVPKYLVHGFKVVVPDVTSDSNQICITFLPDSTFTEEDVWNYFSRYGTVNDVRIPPQERRMYGHVNFLNPGTAKLILSERCPVTPHHINGDQVFVRAYKEKCELEQEKHYIVPVEHGPKYLAYDPKLVMPPNRSDSNQIYLTFMPESTFTEEDVWNYFSQYGPVNDVRIPSQERRMFGYVSFLYPNTAKRILSERSPRTPHFICGEQVLVKAYKEKHELGKLAGEVASVIHEHHKGEQLSSGHKLFENRMNSARDLGILTEKSSVHIAPEMASPTRDNLSVHSVNETGHLQVVNTAEPLYVSNHLDEALAREDRDDFGLPENLDDIF
ncbi:hypothetical protein EJB05_58107 [Eragrostis curvula]|uniref:RRM domain-containing protein n=1 Tax=Eragrostis curvula TaxID=38414 RepID=A0A5J9SC96_9POAL|nr:hypothetical protein EJB05_58107 [Eragrostis curvula]